jgi:hypothetical protein
MQSESLMDHTIDMLSVLEILDAELSIGTSGRRQFCTNLLNLGGILS